MNAALGAVSTIQVSSPIVWLGYAELSADTESRRISAAVEAAQREEQCKSHVTRVRLEFLKGLTREPGLAALWWADQHPAKLSYLKDGSFEALIQAQPDQAEYSLGAATDENSVTVREFLARVSDSDDRAAMAPILQAILRYYVDGDGHGAASALSA